MRLTPEIIAGMHELALEQRRALGGRAPWHVGDVTWGLRQHEGRGDEWTFRVWRDGDRAVAWSWLKSDRDVLEHDVHPEHDHLLDEILDEPDARVAFAFENDETRRSALARHGFDLAERVAVHRDVWAPSRVTESSYGNVMASWPYRRSLDCVVEAPDGRFAAYVLVWPDDENGVGLFEPVGTREEFRRRGLGGAVCTFALRRLHEEGMRQAIVLCEIPAACSLYESVGFARHGTIMGYAR